MPPLYVTAAVTTVLALVMWGPLVKYLKGPTEVGWLGLAFALALPLEPASFYLVRLPLDHWLHGLLAGSVAYTVARTLYAPLTEEGAKLLPLLVPGLRRAIRPENFARYAAAIGLGFGLGEIWMVAVLLAPNPAFVGVPWYAFGGFLGERLMVCICHGGFVSMSLRGLTRGRAGFAAGVATAVLMHFSLNFPIFLAAWQWPPLGETAWSILLQLWTIAIFVGCLALLGRFSGVKLARMLLADVRCPGCGQVYRQRLLGVNLGMQRYEPCPHCKKWHLTGLKDLVDEGAG